MIIAFFSLIILSYGLVLLLASKTWGNLPEIEESGEFKSVSILIAFRNESSNLDALLKSLAKIEYPSNLLEIILINDHSTDNFKDTIGAHKASSPFAMTILNLPNSFTGKKSAVEAGVKKAKHEIILTSDADCTFPKDWVKKMQAPFDIESIKLVSGSVVFKAKSFLSKVFQMEFAPLIGVGAISIELGNATMANGANLAFRKAIFEELEPYKDNLSIPSGDDIFLLQKTKNNYPQGIYFQKEAVVETNPPESLAMLYKQRKRWAAKWSATTKLKDALPALLVWSFHLIYISSIVYSLIDDKFVLLLPIIIFKIIAEGIFIFRILRSQSQDSNLMAFCILQLVYSIYVVIFGLLANFGSYIWKDRKYNSNERARN